MACLGSPSSLSHVDQKTRQNTQTHATILLEPSSGTGLNGGIRCGIQHRRFLFVGHCKWRGKCGTLDMYLAKRVCPLIRSHLARLALLFVPKKDNTTNVDHANSWSLVHPFWQFLRISGARRDGELYAKMTNICRCLLLSIISHCDASGQVVVGETSRSNTLVHGYEFILVLADEGQRDDEMPYGDDAKYITHLLVSKLTTENGRQKQLYLSIGGKLLNNKYYF